MKLSRITTILVIRVIAEKLVGTSLKEFELEAENVDQAYDIIRGALRDASLPYGLSLITINPDAINYESSINITKATRSLGEVINLLCEQAGLSWDFSSSKLTFKPKKAEQDGAGNQLPAE